MKLRPQLMNLIKLLSYPETTVECTCNVCDRSFTDCVDHYIMRCEGLITERMDLWDRLLDCVPCELEFMIIRMNDVETLALLLSRKTAIFKDNETWIQFITNAALYINSLMFVI